MKDERKHFPVEYNSDGIARFMEQRFRSYVLGTQDVKPVKKMGKRNSKKRGENG